MILDPLPNEVLSKEFFEKHLKETLVKGLTALAKAKPHSDPLQVIVSFHIILVHLFKLKRALLLSPYMWLLP